MRTCKYCNGRGYIVSSSVFYKVKKYGNMRIKDNALKLSCTKCYGKGRK